ncbi:phage major tail tube protein [Desulfovibrio sp. ZJ369]|uniref:phage major tail tube protein n=1 Tax=Desulfovibrio sp. ZJ369 TaxID=2709793 RepID=UPI003216C090
MSRRPEQTIAFRAYYNGTDLLGVATIEMPEVSYITETISGSGVAGEYESPALGMTQSMTAKLSWISQTKNFYKLLDSTLQPLLELRASVQMEDEATGIRKAVPLLVTLLAHTKTSPLGSLETGKKHGNETEMEVLRLQVELTTELERARRSQAALSANLAQRSMLRAQRMDLHGRIVGTMGMGMAAAAPAAPGRPAQDGQGGSGRPDGSRRAGAG